MLARRVRFPSHVTEAPVGSRQQLLRYLVVGGCGYVLALVLYAGQLAVGVPPFTAVPLAFVANGLFNFAVNRIWSFPSSGRTVQHELGRFGIIALASLVVNYGSMYLLYEVVGVAALPAQALAIIIATPVGFLGNKLWSFRAA
jgi:putative flippase GtrA